MAIGRKTGGRVPGSLNKRTRDVIEKLESLACDPIEAMARIAQQAEVEGDKTLAAKMYAELAPYCSPKRKAIEQTVVNDWEGRTRESLEAEYKAVLKEAVEEYEALPDAEKQSYWDTEH